MAIDQSPDTSWQVPTRKDALNFWWRSTLLVAWRGLRNVFSPNAKRWPAAQTLNAASILAQRRTPLWADGRSDEFPLIAGKVQNLRVAIPAFHAIEIPAGETFSFWAQLGQPTARRGFVEGREVREGCVVPTLAGGICQISNALATLAQQAGMEFVERHAHSAHIEGQSDSDKHDVIDATVFWNYIDLKLRAPFAWRLEMELSADELIVTIRAAANASTHKAIPVTLVRSPIVTTPPVARGCLTCDQHTCFRHRSVKNPNTVGRTALLLDAWTPEFARYLQDNWHDADYFISVPMRVAFWRNAGTTWSIASAAYRAKWVSWQRALWLRLWSKHEGGRRQASIIDGQRWLAQAYAKRLKPEHTTLVVDQALLPHLAQLGVLGGRRVTVLAHSVPMQTIQERLDAAAAQWPQDASLSDFRAETALVRAEYVALSQAAHIITAHADAEKSMSSISQAIIDVLPWAMPSAPTVTAVGCADDMPTIVFPSTVMARKGIRELAAALRGLRCRLRVLGEPGSQNPMFDELTVEYIARNDAMQHKLLDDAFAVVLPAHVEHHPRILLSALSRGIPVVATSACGIAAREGLHLVDAGDIEGLRNTLVTMLDTANTRCQPVATILEP